MSIPRYSQQFMINASYVHLLGEIVAKWQISADKLYWGTGVEPERLKDLNYKITFQSFKKVICRAIELTNELGLGFHAATQLKISSHGMLGLTATLSPTIQQAIELINQFIHLQCSFIHLSLEIDQDTCHYNIMYDDALGDLEKADNLTVYEFSCAFFLVGFVNICQLFIPSFKPSLDLQCKRPHYFDRFQALLGNTFIEIRYEQAITRLSYPADILRTPLHWSDPLAFEKFKILCQQQLEELCNTQDIVYQVKNSITDAIEGLQNIEQVAQKLNLTKRTLQRMLQEKHQSFQNLYDEVRRDKAKKLLAYSSLQREEIARQLGYSDSSSFYRALKRWGIK